MHKHLFVATSSLLLALGGATVLRQGALALSSADVTLR
jgi:hypothetical protein